MPQHLYFVIDGAWAATMTTENKSGTLYYVVWEGCTTEPIRLDDINTGVQSQPPPGPEREYDFRNDFNHASRAIGAAASVAPTILNALTVSPTKEEGEFQEITVCLHTNFFDRGMISIQPQAGGKLPLRMRIGTGPVRPRNAYPREVFDHYHQVSISAMHGSPLAVVLQILSSEREQLLDALADQR